MTRTASTDELELVLGDDRQDIVEFLRQLQRAALVHPEAARGLFNALVHEGQLFAQTSEGRRWQERVLGSALLERALLVWESATLWIMEDAEPTTPPSVLVDAIATAAASPDRDLLLDALFRDTETG